MPNKETNMYNYNIKLVKEVEKYPCLYNFKLPEYSKKEVTDIAWSGVATVMKDSVENCREKWRNLRTVFVRKLKLNSNSKKIKKPYYLTEIMHFLLPFIKSAKPVPELPWDPLMPDHMPEAEPQIENSYYEEEHDEEEFSLNGDTKFDVDVLIRDDTSLQNSNCEETDQQATSELKVKNFKRPNYETNTHYEDFIPVKKGKFTSSENPRKSFLLSLLPDVEQMTDVQMRKFRRKVIDAIDDVLDENNR